MKRALLIPLIVLATTSLACSLFSRPAVEKIQPTLKAVPVQPASPTSAPTESTGADTAPTQPLEEAASPTIPAEPPAPEAVSPTEPPAPPSSYTETFDEPNDSWSDPFVVTTQAGGREPYMKFSLSGGRLRIAIQDKETYVYKFYKSAVDGGSSIQVVYEQMGGMNNGIAIVCRADPGMTSWYEARLVSGENRYSLYVYDQARKKEGKNPYVLLKSGVVGVKEFSPARGGNFSLTCTDQELTLDLNDGLKVITQPVEAALRGSLVGIGAMSYNLIPANIDIKTVTIQPR